jgi:hypothetical protein
VVEGGMQKRQAELVLLHLAAVVLPRSTADTIEHS